MALEVGSPDLPKGMAGAFEASRDGTARLLLKADPANELVWHELGHFVQWRQLGPGRYIDQPRVFGNNMPEQFVFDLLERPGRWARLTPEFREHSIKVLEKKYGGFSGR